MYLIGVSAISFDLDDTLWSFRTVVERAQATLHSWLLEHAPRVATVLPTPAALGHLRDHYEHSHPDLAGDFRVLRIGSIRLALEMSGEDASLTEQAYGVFVDARHEVEFYDDVMPALQWLSPRFPLIAVTNGNADLRMTGGSEFFRLALSASSLGIAKPAAGIFHAAARAADVSAAEMLHVGDDYDLDVVGALNAGLQAAWLQREDHIFNAPSPTSARAPHLVINNLSMLCRALGGPDTF
ncbi:HAD-IA family hydrolase [Paraburkholderia sp. Ac-20340]|uniref:HAD family hydrolase n=1 Tax=Paraburkholderia sp. Ac-20340 TaxID=2703888 RepID=UPI00197F5B5E|nr:HAD-IA family hydrolase [Paraburkholderia sp. Ac-20340]MBN3858583.1 HAD-IA family hydrolase [Paraburkholderia sp. Ac-20340]